MHRSYIAIWPQYMGGILTLLLPLAGGIYLYSLISDILDVEDYINFQEVGPVSDLPRPQGDVHVLACTRLPYVHLAVHGRDRYG